MTQIMKLLDLAPDIQEQILFLPNLKGLSQEEGPAIPGLLNNGVPKSQERRIGAFLGPLAQPWANHNEAETRRSDGNARNGEHFDESSALTVN